MARAIRRVNGGTKVCPNCGWEIEYSPGDVLHQHDERTNHWEADYVRCPRSECKAAITLDTAQKKAERQAREDHDL